MPIPSSIEHRLRLPAIAAPMFLTSGPDLVVEACQQGVLAAFPSLNQRTSEGFEAWLREIQRRLTVFESETGRLAAPYGVNLIVHKSNDRYPADLEATIRQRVPLVISSLGAVPDLIQKVHDYGGLVFHDVTTVRHAVKAAEAGVDGLILVCAGAGGHGGTLNPLAFLPEVRAFFKGTIVLAGCISTGEQILAAEALGADLAYLGTRFLATDEAICPPGNKQLVVESGSADILYTAAFSGVPANYLVKSVVAAGFDPANLPTQTKLDLKAESHEQQAYKSLWLAGQGCGTVNDILPVSQLCERLIREYQQAREIFTIRCFATRQLGQNSSD